MRYNCTTDSKKTISLDDYLKLMKEGQQKIYFIVSPQAENAVKSPFYEPFKGSDIPVLILNNNIDEMCFQNSKEYKGKKFVNVETSYEEI